MSGPAGIALGVGGGVVLILVATDLFLTVFNLPGLAAGDFKAQEHSLLGAQGAFYLSGGDLTSLSFGDLVPRAAQAGHSSTWRPWSAWRPSRSG